MKMLSRRRNKECAARSAAPSGGKQIRYMLARVDSMYDDLMRISDMAECRVLARKLDIAFTLSWRRVYHQWGVKLISLLIACSMLSRAAISTSASHREGVNVEIYKST